MPIDLGVAHFAVGQHPAPLDEDQRPPEVFGGQQLERGVRLGAPSAVLQDTDPARQAAHDASLGLPLAFLGASASAASRSEIPPWVAQISPTPTPSRRPGGA